MCGLARVRARGARNALPDVPTMACAFPLGLPLPPVKATRTGFKLSKNHCHELLLALHGSRGQGQERALACDGGGGGGPAGPARRCRCAGGRQPCDVGGSERRGAAALGASVLALRLSAPSAAPFTSGTASGAVPSPDGTDASRFRRCAHEHLLPAPEEQTQGVQGARSKRKECRGAIICRTDLRAVPSQHFSSPRDVALLPGGGQLLGS